MKRAQPSKSRKEKGHPLLRLDGIALESNHRTNSEGSARCEENTDLAPGHNCCAVCAGEAPLSGVSCKRCSRVRYCCEEHKQMDAGRHGRVCTLLAAIEKAENELAIDSGDFNLLISQFLASVNAGALESGASWRDVVPEHLAPLLGKEVDEEGGSEEGAEREDEFDRPPSKKQRAHTEQEQAEEEDARMAEASEKSAKEQEREEEELRMRAASMREMEARAREEYMEGEVPFQAGLARELGFSSDYEGDAMEDAACLAQASSFLSFPFTLYYALKECAPIAESAQQAQEEGRPLVITILGAHEDAELAFMDVWKSLEGAAGPGVPIVLQFVGLNVPSWIHKTQEQLSRTITAGYFQGDYQQLADEVLGSSKSRRPRGAVAISAASLAAQCAAAAAAASHSPPQLAPPKLIPTSLYTNEGVVVQGTTGRVSLGNDAVQQAQAMGLLEGAVGGLGDMAGVGGDAPGVVVQDTTGRVSLGNNASPPAQAGVGTLTGVAGGRGDTVAGGGGDAAQPAQAGAGTSGVVADSRGDTMGGGSGAAGAEPSGLPEETNMAAGTADRATGEGSTQEGLPFALAALPDVIVGFNCGLSCEDYDWLCTFRALRRFFVAKHAAAAAGAPEQRKPAFGPSNSSSSSSSSSQAPPVRMPWLLTANTRLEALFDADIVSDHLWEWSMPIHPNPFTSLEPLQSGTLGNDIYRKNAWMAIYEMKPATAAEVEGTKGRAAALRTIRRGLRRGLKHLGNRAGQLVGRVTQAGRSLLPRLGLSWGQSQ